MTTLIHTKNGTAPLHELVEQNTELEIASTQTGGRQSERHEYRPALPCPWLIAGYVLWTILGCAFIVFAVWAMAEADRDMHGVEPSSVRSLR